MNIKIIKIDKEYEPPVYKKPFKKKGRYTTSKGIARTNWLKRKENEQN